jgi:hypothetical protein
VCKFAYFKKLRQLICNKEGKSFYARFSFIPTSEVMHTTNLFTTKKWHSSGKLHPQIALFLVAVNKSCESYGRLKSFPVGGG